MKDNERFKSGFSIVEMAIVLVIIGSILTFSIDYLETSSRQSAISKAENKLDVIENAIQNFVDTNGYLPCPAKSAATIESADYGISTPCDGSATGTDVVTTSVDSTDIRIGVIPTRTLGISDQDMLDSWGNRFTYVAIEELAYDPTAFKDFMTRETTGVIQILDSEGNQLTQTPTTCDGSVDDRTCPVVAYLITSHGSDERGAYSRDGSSEYEACGSTKKDSENCDGDETFVSTFYNDGDVPANYYDDIIRWKTKPQIKNFVRGGT